MQSYLDEGLGIAPSPRPGPAALTAQPVSQHPLAACNSLRRLELTIFVSPGRESRLSVEAGARQSLRGSARKHSEQTVWDRMKTGRRLVSHVGAGPQELIWDSSLQEQDAEI